jgi:hypothetical protein
MSKSTRKREPKALTAPDALLHSPYRFQHLDAKLKVDIMEPVGVLEEKAFHSVAPLDIVDGAARVLHPILAFNLRGEKYISVFMKDFKPAPW